MDEKSILSAVGLEVVDTPLFTATLHRLTDQHFDVEELRTLCHELGVDYDNLRGEGKTAKARELVRFMERHGRLSELADAIRRARPRLILTFEPQRAQELQAVLLEGLQPALKSLPFQSNGSASLSMRSQKTAHSGFWNSPRWRPKLMPAFLTLTWATCPINSLISATA